MHRFCRLHRDTVFLAGIAGLYPSRWLAIVVLVTLLLSMILLWFNVLTPEYLRATVG